LSAINPAHFPTDLLTTCSICKGFLFDRIGLERIYPVDNG